MFRERFLKFSLRWPTNGRENAAQVFSETSTGPGIKSLSCRCMGEHRTSNPPSQSHDAACVEHHPRLSVSTSPSLRGVDRGERQQQTASKTRRYLKWIVVDRARLLARRPLSLNVFFDDTNGTEISPPANSPPHLAFAQ